MKIQVHREYYCGSTELIELPCDWSDVEEWFIKWETFHFRRKGSDKFEEIDLTFDLYDGVDTKRPVLAVILDETGEEELDGR